MLYSGIYIIRLEIRPGPKQVVTKLRPRVQKTPVNKGDIGRLALLIFDSP
jgi:hypothetical protein